MFKRVAAIAVLCVPASLAGAQDKEQSDPTVELVLHVASERYLLDQPVKIYVGVKNTSSKDIPGIYELYPKTDIRLELRTEGQDWTRHIDPTFGNSSEGVGVDIQGVEAGKTVLLEYEMKRVDSARNLVLHKPGKWRVRADNGCLKSREVEFTIKEPRGKDALAHADLEKSFASLGMMYAGGVEVQQPFPKHLQAHPDSAYAPDVAISLAESYMQYLDRGGAGSKFEEMLKICQDALARFDKEWMDHQQAPRAMFIKARIERLLLWAAGKDEQAQDAAALAVLKKIEEKYPIFACTEHYRRARAKLEKKKE